MLVAKPAPEEKVRELVEAVTRHHPGIPIESFLLPRDESCNFQWNIFSTRSFAPLLDWYLYEQQCLNADPLTQDTVLSELLEGIISSSKHTVVVDGNPVPLSISYLRRTDNWISNYTAIHIIQALSRRLGPEYAGSEAALSGYNPWVRATRFILGRSTEGMGLVQRLSALKDGPHGVYQDFPFEAAFFNRSTIYKLAGVYRLCARRRRVTLLRYPTNYYYLVPEWLGYNAAIYAAVPLLFSQNVILRRIRGFNLGPADVQIEFPDGDFRGTWEITIDYDITPIDRIRSWFNAGELQQTVSTLSAEVSELQRERKALSEEAERLASRLVGEEKARRVYQVRAAQADAVARFLHQTSNLVLQPLSSMMIVFEDFIDISEELYSEWRKQSRPEEELTQELDDSLARVKETYPAASYVIDSYRQLFHAFYEIYVSTNVKRDVNQDLRYIETLVQSKYILTQVELELELDPTVPPLKLEGGAQSIFLELMHDAARYGARRILVKSEFDLDAEQVRLSFYNDGEPIPEEKWETALEHEVSQEERSLGIADARYIIETLNEGWLRLTPSDLDRFSVLIVIELLTNRHIVQAHSKGSDLNLQR